MKRRSKSTGSPISETLTDADEKRRETLQRTRIAASQAQIPSVFRPERDALVAGSYNVQRLIGMGSMGGVMLARDQRLDRDVAIKFILPHLVAKKRVRDRFSIEARAMARLRHSNIVTVYAYDIIDDVPYFVMEYVPGTNLKALQSNPPDRPVSYEDVIRILRQLCPAIDAIHEAGGLHLDLKPSNVLVEQNFRIVVTDFGLARSMDGQHSPEDSDRLLGTPAYMCPETIRREPPVPQSDVYSLAVMTYKLLTGRVPFDGDIRSVLRGHVLKQPPHPSDIAPHIPPMIGDAIVHALNKQPDRRPVSAGAFLDYLLEAADPGADTFTGLRFVIADDDTELCHLVAGILEHAFPLAETFIATDGESALRCIEDTRPALAFVDLKMPRMNGLELTLAIRASKTVRKTPIIVMTAFGGATDWNILSSLGANAFLVKPFEPSDLENTVRRLLR